MKWRTWIIKKIAGGRPVLLNVELSSWGVNVTDTRVIIEECETGGSKETYQLRKQPPNDCHHDFCVTIPVKHGEFKSSKGFQYELYKGVPLWELENG